MWDTFASSFRRGLFGRVKATLARSARPFFSAGQLAGHHLASTAGLPSQVRWLAISTDRIGVNGEIIPTQSSTNLSIVSLGVKHFAPF